MMSCNPAHVDVLFREASVQLTEVVDSTQRAADSIMDVVENHLNMHTEVLELLALARAHKATDVQWDRLMHIHAALGEELSSILTALSFQDLTGQRISKVMHALHCLEEYIGTLCATSGIILQGREHNLPVDEDTLKRVAGSVLKGPSKGTSQANVDDCLARLGMN